MEDKTNTKNSGKSSKIIVIIISILIFLCIAFFGLKKIADKLFIDNLFTTEMFALEMDIEESKKGEIISDYDKDLFHLYIELLRNTKKGYLSMKDIAILGADLPGIQILYFELGLDYISFTADQQEFFALQVIRKLKSMSQEDFGHEPDLWQNWQEKKEQSEND